MPQNQHNIKQKVGKSCNYLVFIQDTLSKNTNFKYVFKDEIAEATK